MTFEQLHYFLAIVNNKTFTAAAEELYISQSSLSKCIKSLEIELGSSLFTRGSKYVELTAAGQVFLNYAKRAEYNWASMLNELAMLRENTKLTEVTLGVLPVMDELNIIDHITDFQIRILPSQKYVNLIEGEQDEIVKRLTEGKIDAAIVRVAELNPETFNSVTFIKSELVVVCPESDNELSKKKTVELSDLTGQPFIEFDKTSYLSRKIRSNFDSKGLVPKYTYSFKRHQQILSMVNAGFGIAMIPGDLVTDDKYTNIHVARLAEPLFTDIALVWLKSAPQNDTVLQLAAFFSELKF